MDFQLGGGDVRTKGILWNYGGLVNLIREGPASLEIFLFNSLKDYILTTSMSVQVGLHTKSMTVQVGQHTN